MDSRMIRALSSSLYTHVIEAESNVNSDRFMDKNTNRKKIIHLTFTIWCQLIN